MVLRALQIGVYTGQSLASTDFAMVIAYTGGTCGVSSPPLHQRFQKYEAEAKSGAPVSTQ